MRDTKEPPHCAEIEPRLVGAMFDDGQDENIPLIHGMIGDVSEVFWDERMKLWYETMIAMWKDGDIVRVDTVVPKMEQLGIYDKAGGMTTLSLLASEATIEPYFETYAKMILDAYYRRSLMKACRLAHNRLYDTGTPLVEVRRQIESAAFLGAHAKSASKPEAISEISKRAKKRLFDLAKNEIGRGIKTGIASIDDIMLPMQPGDYVILAARTSVGKTTMACNIILNAAEEGVGVMVFSLEMTKDAIFDKLIQIESKIDISKIQREQYISAFQKEKIEESSKKIDQMNIVVDDESGISPTQMRSKARSVCAKNNIGLIVVDYIGLLKIQGVTDQVVMTSMVSSEIKAMAKELGVPVLALCQINRDGANVKPMLHNLRQSGSLEQDCDIAILLHRANMESNYMSAIIAKQRVGPIGEAPILFERGEQKFFSVTKDGNKEIPGPKGYTRTIEERRDEEPVNRYIEYDYFEDDDTPF